MAGHFLKSGRIGCVVVGADRIAANGDVANKIGTYSVAVLAKENEVPFYVAAPISTLDLSLTSGEQIPIEQRAAAEVTHIRRPRRSRGHASRESRLRRHAQPLRHRHHHRTRRRPRALLGIPAKVGKLKLMRFVPSAFRVLSAAFCLLLSAFCLFAASGQYSNRRAPGFALPDPEYKHYYDLQDYRGKVVVVDIMSTRCPHCLLLSTTLEKVKSHYGDKVVVLEVVLPPDNQSTIAKYIQTNKVTVPVIADMGQMTASYFNANPATMQHIDVPHMFLIDSRGMIRNDFGYDDSTHAIFEGNGLFNEIDKLLK